MKKVLILALVILAIAIVTLATWPQQQRATPSSRVSNDTVVSKQPNSTNHHHAAPRVPAHYTTAPRAGELKRTLAPELFDGNTRLAYQAATDIPETLAQLPCYCHCDMSKGHRSLLSCFEDEHGANCGICIGEAVMAQNLRRQGLTTAQIQQRIISAYAQSARE